MSVQTFVALSVGQRSLFWDFLSCKQNSHHEENLTFDVTSLTVALSTLCSFLQQTLRSLVSSCRLLSVVARLPSPAILRLLLQSRFHPHHSEETALCITDAVHVHAFKSRGCLVLSVLVFLRPRQALLVFRALSGCCSLSSLQVLECPRSLSRVFFRNRHILFTRVYLVSQLLISFHADD